MSNDTVWLWLRWCPLLVTATHLLASRFCCMRLDFSDPLQRLRDLLANARSALHPDFCHIFLTLFCSYLLVLSNVFSNPNRLRVQHHSEKDIISHILVVVDVVRFHIISKKRHVHHVGIPTNICDNIIGDKRLKDVELQELDVCVT